MVATKTHITFICTLAVFACYMLTGTASADETNPYMGAPVVLVDSGSPVTDLENQ